MRSPGSNSLSTRSRGLHTKGIGLQLTEPLLAETSLTGTRIFPPHLVGAHGDSRVVLSPLGRVRHAQGIASTAAMPTGLAGPWNGSPDVKGPAALDSALLCSSRWMPMNERLGPKDKRSWTLMSQGIHCSLSPPLLTHVANVILPPKNPKCNCRHQGDLNRWRWRDGRAKGEKLLASGL